jgi:cephalosporin-C deacetylase-like acetyl esterase
MLPAYSVRAQVEDLNVFTRWFHYSHPDALVRDYLNSVAFEQLQKRRDRVAGLKGADDWRRRQGEVKAALARVLGPFPERTPLNARITRTIEKGDFRIEHVVFESRPNFYVTASLFLPKALSGKAPAVLNVIGHTDIAFRSPFYQRLILNLVRKKFIVLAMDPIGQGERLQYFDPQLGRSLVGGATTEHSYVGKQCFLTGDSAAAYFAWDGIRAIDYLQSRPEVDPQRIGVTGISGGGTQTSYISAVDERVRVAAPANYICGLRRLYESIGPQDGEQNVNAGVVNGLDHGDFLEVRAPKPTLMMATTRDFFSIQGARETYREAKAAFEALGAPENLAITEDDAGHDYTKKNLEALYAFLQKHLENPGDPVDGPVDLLTMEELTISPTGQLIGSLEGETVFSLNRKRAADLLRNLAKRRSDPGHLERVRQEARRISGYVDPGPPADAVFRGRYRREGYAVEQYFIPGEGNIALPFLLFRPEQPPRPRAVLYLHPQGQNAAAAPGGEIEQLVRMGYAVLAPDLSGTGELGEAGDSTTYLGVVTGRSLTGIRAGDIVRMVRFLKSEPGIDAGRVAAVSLRGMATALLHATAWEPAIAKVALIEPFVSFAAVALNRYYQVSFADVVPNSLTAYDLPDLEAALAPRPLLIVNPADHLMKPVSSAVVEQEFGLVRDVYRSKGARAVIERSKRLEEIRELLESWLND